VKGETDAVAELKAECGHFIREAKAFRLRPNFDDRVG
jgi:hypothetical protein